MTARMDARASLETARAGPKHWNSFSPTQEPAMGRSCNSRDLACGTQTAFHLDGGPTDREGTMPLPYPWEIEDLERSRRIRRDEGLEVDRIPLVERIRPTTGYVPSIDEERRGVVTILTWGD
jgi:hypothetical protein